MPTRRSLLISLVGAVGAATVKANARTADYPSRPIVIVVPAAAGGPGDRFGRIIADHIKQVLGQPAVIENFGGASGIIGADRVARAANDGYTLLLGNLTTNVLLAASSAVPYNVINDFEPIALVASNPLVIATKKTMPAKNLRELIAELKTNEQRALVGTVGPGSLPHLAGLLFEKQIGASFHYVPYRGASIADQDLMAGQIDVFFGFSVSCLPLVRAGLIKVYAIPGSARLAAAPEIPTVDEAGLPGFYAAGWNSLWAPRGTPKDIIVKLNSIVAEAYDQPDVRHQLAEIGQIVPPRDQQTPEALRSFQKTEIEKWWPIIKTAGIKTE